MEGQTDLAQEQLIDGTSVSTRVGLEHEFVVPFEAAVSGEYEYLLLELASHAQASAAQLEAQALSVLSNVCDAAGQVVRMTPGTSFVDHILQLIDRVQLSFDANGRPDFSGCYLVRQVGGKAEYVSAMELLSWFVRVASDDQKRSLLSIIGRQRNERDSGQRSF